MLLICITIKNEAFKRILIVFTHLPTCLNAVADPDLQVKRGGGHPDPEKRGAVSEKIFLGLLGLSLV